MGSSSSSESAATGAQDAGELRALLLEPFPSKRWISIIRYCEAIAGRAPFDGIELSTAIAPWWNPLSLADGARRHWTRQPELTEHHGVVHLSDQALGHHVGRFAGTPTVVTCHDVMPFVVPNFYRNPRAGRIKRRLLQHSIHGMLRATRIIAVSARTADDLSRRFSYPRSRISIVPNIVGNEFHPIPDSEASLAAQGLLLPNGPRILSVGHCGGYKNLERLIDALATPSLASAAVVRVGWPITPLQRRRAGNLGVLERIVELGRVSNEQLAQVYSSCDVLAQPSVYEGFGVPVIEAMACALPVVCSDGGALPEVAGDAAVVAACSGRDAAAVNALAEALSRVLNEPGLREDLRARGLQRAARFRPDAVLPRLASVYRETATG